MSYELIRPDHLDDTSWATIESYRSRFENAIAHADRPAIIGAGKDLIECIARCVLNATEAPLGDSAKVPKVIYEAQKALNRVAGPDIGASDEVNMIAKAAQTIASSVNTIRNQVGTGHGRARQLDIDDEMATIVSDATMLWCRWALRRLGHLLAGYPNVLLAEVNTPVSLDRLQQHFDEVRIPHQPLEIQHAIGVAFGQQAAGGFMNAFIVGVKPAAESPDLSEFPTEYRLGLAEGMIIDRTGQIGLTEPFVSDFIDVLMPVPDAQGLPAIAELAAKAQSATWINRWRMSPVDPARTMQVLRREQRRLDTAMQKALDELCRAIDPATRT